MAITDYSRKGKRNPVVGQATASKVCAEIAAEYGVDVAKLRAKMKLEGFGKLPEKVGGKGFYDTAKLTKAMKEYAATLNKVYEKPAKAEPKSAAVIDQRMALEMQAQMNRIETSQQHADKQRTRIESKLDALLKEMGVKWEGDVAATNGKLDKEPVKA